MLSNEEEFVVVNDSTPIDDPVASVAASKSLEEDMLHCQEITDDGYRLRLLPDDYGENSGKWQALNDFQFPNNFKTRKYGYGKTKEEACRNARNVATLLYARHLFSDNRLLKAAGQGQLPKNIRKALEVVS